MRDFNSEFLFMDVDNIPMGNLHSSSITRTPRIGCEAKQQIDRNERKGRHGHDGPESTCLVRRPDWQRVLRICDVGYLCTIRGVIHRDCELALAVTEHPKPSYTLSTCWSLMAAICSMSHGRTGAMP